MDLSKVTGKIKEVPAKIKETISGFFSIFREFKLPHVNIEKPDFSLIQEKFRTLLDWIGDFVNRLLDRVPEDKKKPFLIGFGGIVCLVLIILIAAIALRPGRQNSTTNMARAQAIPQEELFLPAEPDFVPEFLLEREPRKAWTLEDIRPYWKTPEIGDYLREEIKSAVDKLMEGIP